MADAKTKKRGPGRPALADELVTVRLDKALVARAKDKARVDGLALADVFRDGLERVTDPNDLVTRWVDTWRLLLAPLLRDIRRGRPTATRRMTDDRVVIYALTEYAALARNGHPVEVLMDRALFLAAADRLGTQVASLLEDGGLPKIEARVMAEIMTRDYFGTPLFGTPDDARREVN